MNFNRHLVDPGFYSLSLSFSYKGTAGNPPHVMITESWVDALVCGAHPNAAGNYCLIRSLGNIQYTFAIWIMDRSPDLAPSNSNTSGYLAFRHLPAIIQIANIYSLIPLGDDDKRV